MVDLVTGSSVVVQFIPIKIGEPTRAVVYNVGVPFLAGLYSCCAEVSSPFCLALYKKVACELVCGTYGPPSLYLKYLRDSIQFNTGLASNVSADGVSNMVPSRGVGVEADEYPEVVSGWGGSRRLLPLAMCGCGLAVRVKSLRVVCRGCGSARRTGVGSYTAVGRRRSGLGVAECLLPKAEKAAGEVLGEVAFRAGWEFLSRLVKVRAEGSEDL